MDGLRTIASHEELSLSMQAMAQKIIHEHGADRPLFVALLRGAAPFASKLMFEMTALAPEMHPELDYMMVSTYGDGREAGTPRIVTDLAPDTIVKDRLVIVLDDVLDKGITADFVTTYLKQRGAKTIKLAVLATKAVPTRTFEADYSCLEAPDAWLVGMGMDNADTAREAYRWLDAIKAIEPTNQS